VGPSRDQRREAMEEAQRPDREPPLSEAGTDYIVRLTVAMVEDWTAGYHRLQRQILYVECVATFGFVLGLLGLVLGLVAMFG
jgi:biopolymer transport protein ExbB/TolQ